MTNFPKLHCPFTRQRYKVNVGDWNKHGRRLQLRTPEVYLITSKINPGYDWVFDDNDTFAVEKLNGTNIKILTEDGRLQGLQNRKNVIDVLQIIKGKTFIMEGVFQAISKGFIKPNGEQAGELIGPKVQGNPYKLNTHLFYPFTRAIKFLRYNSFEQHDRTYTNWSLWFEHYLFSRFAGKHGNKDIYAEGLIFYNLKRKAQGKTYMAKLRRDMFRWYYEPDIKIEGI